MEITAEKISKLSLLKFIFVGFFFGISCMAIPFGVASIFGAEVVTWHGEVKTGLEGILYALLMIPLFSIALTWIMGIFLIIGLWVYSFFGPVKLKFKNVIETQSDV